MEDKLLVREDNKNNNTNNTNNKTELLLPNTEETLKEINKEKYINKTKYKGIVYSSSFFLSRLLFCWTCKAIRLSRKYGLKTDYLGDLETEFQTETFAYNANLAWKIKRNTTSLWRVILSMNCCRLTVIY